MKRQRSRGRGKPLNNNPNRAYESVGPDMKVRGSAQTILERYQQAGRDAMGSGDRVLAENYLQHAEHYLRLIKSIMPNFIPRSELAIAGLPSDYDEDDDFEGGENEAEEAGDDAGEGQAREPREPRPQNEMRDNRNRNYDRNDRGERNNGERNNGERGPDDGNNGRYNNRDRNNRNRNRFRSDYRNNGENGQENDNGRGENYRPQEQQSFAPQSDLVVEQGSEPRNEATSNENREPSRRPPRSRPPRGPRNSNDAVSTAPGFGDEAPAFLKAPTPNIAEAE
ncbi:MAG: cytosolic protein [Hyphomonadaceae bacterium]|nr:MAG: cytosolic protein [Hyphomonadaceae bacterium]